MLICTNEWIINSIVVSFVSFSLACSLFARNGRRQDDAFVLRNDDDDHSHKSFSSGTICSRQVQRGTEGTVGTAPPRKRTCRTLQSRRDRCLYKIVVSVLFPFANFPFPRSSAALMLLPKLKLTSALYQYQ